MMPFDISRLRGVKNFGLTELFFSVIPQYFAVHSSILRWYQVNLSFSSHGLQARDELIRGYLHTAWYSVQSPIDPTRPLKVRELLTCARAYSDARDHIFVTQFRSSLSLSGLVESVSDLTEYPEVWGYPRSISSLACILSEENDRLASHLCRIDKRTAKY